MTASKNGETRILALSDLHCGHIGGITPPGYRTSEKIHPGWPEMQAKCWDRATRFVKSRKWDAVLLMGDNIDGRDEKSGGQELCISQPRHQCEAAAEFIRLANCKRMAGVYGTPYHTGKLTEEEDYLYKNLLEIPPERVGDQLLLDIDGLIVDMRHDISGSSTPTGGDIALRKIAIDTRLWHLEHGRDLPRLILRGHVHYHRVLSDGIGRNSWTVATLPALQTFTKFGRKRVQGRVIQWGIASIIYDRKTGEIRWEKDTAELCTIANMKATKM